MSGYTAMEGKDGERELSQIRICGKSQLKNRGGGRPVQESSTLPNSFTVERCQDVMNYVHCSSIG